jgi:hypothetical protein
MGESDLQGVLGRKYSARLFAVVVCFVLFAIAMLGHIILPAVCGNACAEAAKGGAYGLLIKLCDDLFAAIFVTVGISVALFRLLPPAEQSGKVEPISAQDIAELYENALKTTCFWQFKGGTGTYLRSNTLPAMQALAKQQKVDREVHIEIINPSCDDICEQYARYRRIFASQQSMDKELWTATRVKDELYATIVSAALIEGQALKIKIGLSSTWSSFRFDASSEHVIVTNEDPSAPALRSDKDTNFYRFFRKELQISLDQAQVLVLQPCNATHDSLNPDKVLEILEQQLGRSFKNDGLTRTRLDNIMRKVQHPVNYYAR